ncbi:MAG: hypothetical protein WCE52_10680, partial [Candidatus Acidiferrum sp.]
VWGLPDSVIEAVAFHHRPSKDGQSQFSPLVATHMASIYFERQNPYWLQDGTVMDVDYLRKTGCLEREQFWSHALEGAPPENLKVSRLRPRRSWILVELIWSLTF